MADLTDTAPLTLIWGTEGTADVANVAELDEQLDQLTSEAERKPLIVELISPDHGSLGIGLGRPETIVSYVSASGDPPYYASRGDADAAGFIDFMFQGSYSEYPRNSAVPIDVGREAMRRFFERPHALPGNIEWQEV